MEPKPALVIDPAPDPSPRDEPVSNAKVRALRRAVRRLKLIAGLAAAIAALALIGLYLTYQRFSNLRPIVQAAGQNISKRDYDEILEQRDGGKTLHDLVSAALIRQAAAQAGVLPSDSDVSARLANLRQSDPAQVQAADAAGSLPLLRDQILAQIALDNLRIQKVPASEAEINRYYAAHHSDFQQRAQARMTLVVADTADEAKTAADDLHDTIPPEILAQQKGLHVAGQNGYQVNLGTPQGRALAASWKSMHVGETQTDRLGRQFLVAQLVSIQDAQTRPLEDIRSEIARRVRLQKAVSTQVELTRLYQATPPVFMVDKYAQYFVADPPDGH